MVEGNVIFNRKNTILMKNLTKTLIMAVLPLMFFGLFTCQPESDPAIYQAESFMDVYPDSAFLLLKNILKPEKLSAEEYATWCLLMTQARDKNYMEHTSDSMINVAVKYFESPTIYLKIPSCICLIEKSSVTLHSNKISMLLCQKLL